MQCGADAAPVTPTAEQVLCPPAGDPTKQRSAPQARDHFRRDGRCEATESEAGFARPRNQLCADVPR